MPRTKHCPSAAPSRTKRCSCWTKTTSSLLRPTKRERSAFPGTALALGYYADPARTAQAFTQNPLNSSWYERIYRTGDLARYDEAGELYYIGRKDFQIKHMGHRVELGEIEAAAMRCDEVSRGMLHF